MKIDYTKLKCGVCQSVGFKRGKGLEMYCNACGDCTLSVLQYTAMRKGDKKYQSIAEAFKSTMLEK